MRRMTAGPSFAAGIDEHPAAASARASHGNPPRLFGMTRDGSTPGRGPPIRERRVALTASTFAAHYRPRCPETPWITR